MSVTDSVVALLAICVVINLTLTAGIVIRLRSGSPGTRAHEVVPQPGYQLRMTEDSYRWLPKLSDSRVLYALVAPGCPGCKNLEADLRSIDVLDTPVYVIVDGSHPEGRDYGTGAARWSQVSAVHYAPGPADTLDEFSNPPLVPTLIMAVNGVVVASGFRLKDVLRSAANNAVVSA